MRLIDADAMEKQAYDDVHYNAELEDWEFDVLTHYLDHAPTIDAVQVVRCKDCENHRWYTNRYGVEISTCTLLCVDVGIDDFCSYGEKRCVDAE